MKDPAPGRPLTLARRLAAGREPSADLLRQLDDDPLRATDVAEPIAVFVALHLANELRAAGSQASDDGVDVVDCESDMADARGVRRRVPVIATEAAPTSGEGSNAGAARPAGRGQRRPRLPLLDDGVTWGVRLLLYPGAEVSRAAALPAQEQNSPLEVDRSRIDARSAFGGASTCLPNPTCSGVLAPLPCGRRSRGVADAAVLQRVGVDSTLAPIRGFW